MGELKATIQRLTDENATLKAAASKKRGRHARGEETSEAYEIGAIAKKYCLTIGLWLDRLHFMQDCPDIDPTSDDAFASEEAIRARMIKELYQAVPDKFHDQLRNVNGFYKVVR